MNHSNHNWSAYKVDRTTSALALIALVLVLVAGMVREWV